MSVAAEGPSETHVGRRAVIGFAGLTAVGVLFGARAQEWLDGLLPAHGGVLGSLLPVAQARRDDVIGAYEMDGRPLSTPHGGPARLYVAPMYGYKSCKWLREITVTGRVVPGFWESRGYDVDGWVGRSNGRGDRPT